MKTFPFSQLVVVSLVLTLFSQRGDGQSTYVKPYGIPYDTGNRSETFSPSGLIAAPWSLLDSGIKMSAGGTVEILGGPSIFGSRRLDRPTKLTRNSANGTVKIGAVPVAETAFRAIAYNVWLGDPNPLNFSPSWANTHRASAIRNYNWGSWDFFGFCEVWDTSMNDNHLQHMGPHRFNGFNLAGSAQHSGLLGISQYPHTDFFRGEFTAGSGADFLSSKGWIRARIQKNGFGIWVFMTHMQADDGPTWQIIYDVRRSQMEEILTDMASLRNNALYVNDVFFLMGDLNVYGDSKIAPGGGNTPEYPMMNEVCASKSLDAIDTGRQFHESVSLPQQDTHTFSHNNTLTLYHYSSTTLADSARLDYIIGVSSKSGKVVIEPTKYEVIRAMSPTAFTESGHTDRNLSDHYAVGADFRIIRTAN